MRNYIECKICCAKCGAPLEIKYAHEVPKDVRGRYQNGEAASPFAEHDHGHTGAAKIQFPIFVETCRYCQEEIESPARKIADGLAVLMKAKKGGVE